MPFPSPRQRFNKHGLARFSCIPGEAPDEAGDCCAICREDYFEYSSNIELIVQIKVCGHFFHQSCLLIWLASTHLEGKQGTCPLCRDVLYRRISDVRYIDHFVLHLAELTRQIPSFSKEEQMDVLLIELQEDLEGADFTEKELDYWKWEVRKLQAFFRVFEIDQFAPVGYKSTPGLMDTFLGSVKKVLDAAVTREMREMEADEFIRNLT